jgi:death-on-curing protein
VGALESALARPLNKLAYEPESDLASLAAAYGYGLATNHAYVDGNKRVAFMAMYVFLGLNGQELEATQAEVVDIMLAVADGRLGETELAAWVREHVEDV